MIVGRNAEQGTRSPETAMNTLMTEDDLNKLYAAVQALKHPSLAARLSDLAGRPIQLMRDALPQTAYKAITLATTKALNSALRVALRTIQNVPEEASPRLHKTLAAGTGAIGGSFGLLALPVELPISTVIMLRSILDLAREQGEDLNDPEAALGCLQVFALGGLPSEITGDGYLTIRALVAKSLTEAARFVAERGITAQGAPVVVRFIAQIASRFGVVVTQKVVAQALPLFGAFGGAAVNYAFIDHFRALGGAHFAVRRLERVYGNEVVRAEFESVRASVRMMSAAGTSRT
jgi:hypothetical protein